MAKWTLIVVLALAALAALAAPALAVLSGENGRIVFASGREAGDLQAKLYFLPVPSSTGGGSVSRAFDPFAVGQYRHPTWSPDRTQIAYARGDSVGANFDIYVQDLTTPGSTPVNITNSNNVTDDRPAWSPDGTRIAYESEVTDGSGQMDVLMRDAPGGGGVTNLTNTTAAGEFEGKPAWSPDSQTVYYAVGDVTVAPNGNTNDVKIFKEPADNSGGPTQVIHISGGHAFQPSISPDGASICFTVGLTAGLNTTASIFVAPLSSPSSAAPLASSGSGDYNCTWSPDGAFVAYVTGTFSNGSS